MSTYVMSDIHSNFAAFEKMLDLIKFNDNDHIYILGDLFDRNYGAQKIIDKVYGKENITILMGNHEDMMLEYYEHISGFSLWANNGGYPTREALREMGEERRNEILAWASKFPLTLDIECNGQKYLLGHADPTANNRDDILWHRLTPDDKVPDDIEGIVICGHTPVLHLRNLPLEEELEMATMIKSKDGRIWFIDCGAGHPVDGRCQLCCVRLDDEKEFYVKARAIYGKINQ